MEEWVVSVSGSSLDNTDWSKLPKNRIAVNYASLLTPDYTYISVVDKVNMKKYFNYNGIAPRLMYKAMYKQPGDYYNWGENIIILDYFPCGSFDLAVYFSISKGAKKIILVGSDAEGTNSKSFKDRHIPDNYSAWCKKVLDRIYSLGKENNVKIVHNN
jgi:hypothetical protein